MFQHVLFCLFTPQDNQKNITIQLLLAQHWTWVGTERHPCSSLFHHQLSVVQYEFLNIELHYCLTLLYKKVGVIGRGCMFMWCRISTNLLSGESMKNVSLLLLDNSLGYRAYLVLFQHYLYVYMYVHYLTDHLLTHLLAWIAKSVLHKKWIDNKKAKANTGIDPCEWVHHT